MLTSGVIFKEISLLGKQGQL